MWKFSTLHNKYDYIRPEKFRIDRKTTRRCSCYKLWQPRRDSKWLSPLERVYVCICIDPRLKMTAHNFPTNSEVYRTHPSPLFSFAFTDDALLRRLTRLSISEGTSLHLYFCFCICGFFYFIVDIYTNMNVRYLFLINAHIRFKRKQKGTN